MERKKRKKRSCGECIACCVYLRIVSPELEKKGLEHCPYLDLPGPIEKNKLWYTGGMPCNNCKVFNTEKRPEVCEGYKCAWLLGAGDEEDRPDKCLMMFDRLNDIKNAIEAKPLAEKAYETEKGKAAIDRMSKDLKKPILVLSFYERTLLEVVGKGV